MVCCISTCLSATGLIEVSTTREDVVEEEEVETGEGSAGIGAAARARAGGREMRIGTGKATLSAVIVVVVVGVDVAGAEVTGVVVVEHFPSSACAACGNPPRPPTA
jgi:hypothetical protein